MLQWHAPRGLCLPLVCIVRSVEQVALEAQRLQQSLRLLLGLPLLQTQKTLKKFLLRASGHGRLQGRKRAPGSSAVPARCRRSARRGQAACWSSRSQWRRQAPAQASPSLVPLLCCLLVQKTDWQLQTCATATGAHLKVVLLAQTVKSILRLSAPGRTEAVHHATQCSCNPQYADYWECSTHLQVALMQELPSAIGPRCAGHAQRTTRPPYSQPSAAVLTHLQQHCAHAVWRCTVLPGLACRR